MSAVPVPFLADACNPSVPGCNPEAHGAAATISGLLLLVLAFMAVVVGLVIFAIVRRAHRGPQPLQLQGAWFPDPSGDHRWRWWDGARWTPIVSDGDTPRVDTP